MRRPSLSHILIALAAILAFVFNFLALQDRGKTTLVAVADGPIDAGSRVGPEDIRLVEIDASFAGLSSLIGEDRWESMQGWVAVRPIPEGGVIEASGLVPPTDGSGLRTMSIPVAPEHAAGGLLEVGDAVDVITVSDGVASFVVSDVDVVGVAADASTGIGGSGGYHVVLAVDAGEALRLAAAIDSGSIEIVRSTGAEPASGQEGNAP